MPATSRSRAYGRLVLKTRERPFAGAQVGLDEAQALTRVLKTEFALERISVPSPAEVAPAVVQARDARGIHFFIVDAPADAFKPLAAAVRGRDVLIFNATAADDALRREVCAAQFVHTLPSLAMGMDGLVQYLVSRKWSNLLVFEGPLPADAVMAKAFENSAKKFGARIVARQQFKPGTDPREREQNDPALLSAINRDYDVVFVADHAFDFARQVPYHTVRARPVVGSIDLEADRLALDLGAQRRAAGELPLSEAHRRAATWKGRTGRRGSRSRWWCRRRCARARRSSTSSASSSSTKGHSTATRVSPSACGRGTTSCVRRSCSPRLIPWLRSAPVEGFLHKTNELDTLGDDEPETPCRSEQVSGPRLSHADRPRRPRPSRSHHARDGQVRAAAWAAAVGAGPAADVARGVRRRLLQRVRGLDHSALQDLHHLSGLYRAGAAGNYSVVPRHAVFAVHGL